MTYSSNLQAGAHGPVVMEATIAGTAELKMRGILVGISPSKSRLTPQSKTFKEAAGICGSSSDSIPILKLR